MPINSPRCVPVAVQRVVEYGARIGAARVLRPFDDYDVKATIYACDRALERNPDIARPVLDTVARAGAGSPWLELALRAPWQGDSRAGTVEGATEGRGPPTARAGRDRGPKGLGGRQGSLI